jgi:hypothetical protein
MARSGNTHLDTANPEAATENNISLTIYIALTVRKYFDNFTEPLVFCPVLLEVYIQLTGNVFPRFFCPFRT